MIKKIVKFATRLFAFRNLVALFTIAIAIIGSIGIKPFGITYSTEQIVLAVLAFLAMDALVERLDILTNIANGVESIQQATKPKLTASVLLKKRKEFPRMEKIIDDAKSEIWITGVTFDSLIPFTSSFQEKLEQGCSIRFMAPDPDGKALDMAAKYYGYDPKFYAARIKSNLAYICERLRPTKKGSLEIRVLDMLFPSGYIVTDRSTPAGRNVFQSYLYKTSPQESPAITIYKESDAEWFSIYLIQLEKAWEDAKPFKTTTFG
ncbi:MAG: hypothetical protein HY869_01155 [Chloroflexi bacterium]|nr:hypothetical protein [Chloroflexota bacterium]